MYVPTSRYITVDSPGITEKSSAFSTIPPHIKVWIANNLPLAKDFLKVLEAVGIDFGALNHRVTHQKLDTDAPNPTYAAKHPSATHLSGTAILGPDYDKLIFAPAPPRSDSSMSQYPSPPSTITSDGCNKRKRTIESELEPHHALSKEHLTTLKSRQTYLKQDSYSAVIPTPFIPPDLTLTYSIDHSTTNPSNDIRLRTPYPAPSDILSASKAMFDTNLATALSKPLTYKVPWTIFEDDQIIRHMLAIRHDPAIPATEERFAEVSKRLGVESGGHGVFRSKTAIKNMWCRVGRGRSGFDERKGTRKDEAHVVNGWKAKPGNEKPRFGTGGTKKVKVGNGRAAREAGGYDGEWFEL